MKIAVNHCGDRKPELTTILGKINLETLSASE